MNIFESKEQYEKAKQLYWSYPHSHNDTEMPSFADQELKKLFSLFDEFMYLPAWKATHSYKETEKRRCTDCKLTKYLHLFYRNKAEIKGKTYRCKPCEKKSRAKKRRVKRQINFDLEKAKLGLL